MAKAPRLQFYWAQVEGHGIHTMSRKQWEQLQVCDDKTILVDVKITPLAEVVNDAIVVAATATKNSTATASISIFRYDEKDTPTPYNKDEYDVWTNLSAHPDLQSMITAASTSNNKNFRIFCSENVFLVKREAGVEHWLPGLPAQVKLLLKST